MPRGIYLRTEAAKANIAAVRFGKPPANKGQQRQDVLRKVELFRRGLEIECKLHGHHTNWRLHSKDNVQCRYCAAESQRESDRKYPLRFLVKWAKRRGRECTITEEQIKALWDEQEGCCALSGVRFGGENRPSLDRINPAQGYVTGNVQLVLHEVNRMKTDLLQERFTELCDLIALKKAGKSKKK